MFRRFSYFSAFRPPWPPFTGYLANWKMFEPRKLIPLSIELWSAPMAVITEITEKTPMVMPDHRQTRAELVRAERLHAPWQ